MSARRAGGVSVVLAAIAAAACAPGPNVPSPAPRAAVPVASTKYESVAEYMEARARLVERDRARRLGAGLRLTAAEERADGHLERLRQAELERTRGYFAPAHSYLRERTKAVIRTSPLLDVMKRMPKGGILHAHGSAMGDFRRLISTATYRPDCYIYTGSDSAIVSGSLRISSTPPGEGWRRAIDVRRASGDPAGFDEEIYRSITLGEEDLAAASAWDEMSKAFRRTSGLLAEPAVRDGYWRDMFAALIAENVQYLESRTTDIDGALVAEARTRDPVFDVKFIPAAVRSNTRERMRELLAGALERRASDPARIKGFDLVEEEDRTNTNLFFIEELLAARRAAEERGLTQPLYLHSGESTRPENENLYDAVLLGAPRIGHGLALIKHPLLMEIVKDRDVAVEICPISNQVLGYVADLRNHPAVHYVSVGLPIVLSPDDPAIMRQTFSEDFYVAVMAWGLDLRALKQLAMNSLQYSTMAQDEKARALAAWSARWETFVEWLNQSSVSPRPSSSPPR